MPVPMHCAIKSLGSSRLLVVVNHHFLTKVMMLRLRLVVVVIGALSCTTFPVDTEEDRPGPWCTVGPCWVVMVL